MNFLKLIFLTYILFFTWLITHGNFNLFTGEGGSAFDSLSKSLLHFQCSVDNSSIGWEAFIVNGKSYMYFGPFPAILRIILNFFFPELSGKWSLFSCLLSCMLSIISFSILLNMVLEDNDNLSRKLKYFFFLISQLTFAFGTPIFFVTSHASIFHESILWALAFSILSMVFLYKLLRAKTNSLLTFFMFSICIGLSFLSKINYGVFLYVIWAAYIIKIIKGSKKNILKLFMASSPAFIALVFQFWYNFCRFENIFTSVNFKYYYPWIQYPSEFEMFKKIGGILNFHRISTTLFNYFGLRAEYFSSKLPFFTFSLPKLNAPSIFMTYQERMISLTIVSLFFVATSIIGLFWMIREKNNFFTKFCALCFFGQIVFILSYIGMTHRYSVDFMPFFVFMYSYFISKIGHEKFLIINGSTKLTVTLITFLSLFSIVSTVFSTLYIVSRAFGGDSFKLSVDVFFNFINMIFHSIYSFLF